MTQENKTNITQQHVNASVYQQPYENDEIDLRELIKVIWDYKWLTIVMCAIAIAGSVFLCVKCTRVVGR